jgi:hypothetical protein
MSSLATGRLPYPWMIEENLDDIRMMLRRLP